MEKGFVFNGIVSQYESLMGLKDIIERIPMVVFKMKKGTGSTVVNVFCEGMIAREWGINTGAFGENVEEPCGRNVATLFPKDLSDVMMPAFLRAFCGEEVKLLFEFRGKVYSLMVKSATVNTVRGTQDTVHDEIVGQITEFVEHNLMDKDLTRHINHDQLTGLPNRVLFYDRLLQAIVHAERKQHRFALLVFDLDRFKLINESLGHAVGDEILKAVADRLVKQVLQDHTVARIGGDGFAIIFEEIESDEDVRKAAGEFIHSLSKPFIVEGHELYINSSVGICLYPNDGVDLDTLMKNADIALHQAKEMGLNTYQQYRHTMNSQNEKRLKLQNDLHRAIERQEFEVYYQPQTSQAGETIIGMEALLRWKHPQLGMISPGEFIPVAEETGMIVAIGEWVLREACAQAKKWQVSGYEPVRMSVNLSPRQFQQDNLLEMISDVLDDTRLEAHYLVLEITESVSMQNIDFVTKTLHELNQLGIQVSIDDFGTGYSSLLYLKRFPIQSLKIDRSFIRDIIINSDAAKIALAVIAMAHSLNLKVIAEGVETVEQLEYLMKHRCDNFQGYLFSEPLPADVIERMFLQKQ